MEKHFGDGLVICWRYREIEESRIAERLLDLENWLNGDVIQQGDELFEIEGFRMLELSKR